MGRFAGVEIYSTNDIEWNSVVDTLPADMQDIYFTAEYHALYERILGSRAELFVYREEDMVGVYPYLKTEIKRDYLDIPFYDIETVYGYGGPLVSSDTEFVSRFEQAFVEYCKESNIVAEFVRFHPILRNENIFKGINVLHNRITVSVDLSVSEDDIWNNQLSSGNRNVIRKCIKNGLYVEKTDDYRPFHIIYNETMQRVGAESFYYFDENMIRSMAEEKNYTFLVCKKDDEILAAAIFMGYGPYYHYHLSGSHRDAMKFNPNNLLLWEAIKYGKQQGHKIMHLGGGLSDSKEDNLYKFKAHFSKTCNDFFIGKRIHNNDVYEKLIDEWKRKTGKQPVKLLQYKEMK